jgi:TetR/AcrR family transcriptional regulator, transcriptional repressor for nem operon
VSRTLQKRQRALTQRGSATRQKIIEAAAALVYAVGAARLNLDEVMAASRTSKSQLYHYFTDKEALIQEVIAYQTKRVLTVNSNHLEAIDSFQALRRWRDDLVDRNRALGGFGGCPIGSLADELANHSPPARKRLANGFEAWTSRIENALRNMKAKGLLKASTEPKELSLAVLAAIQGGLLLAKVSRTSRPLEIAFDMALDHVARCAT